MIVLTPIKLGMLTAGDIGIPLLFVNKGEREYCILTDIRDDDMIEVHFGQNIHSLVVQYKQLFKISIN